MSRRLRTIIKFNHINEPFDTFLSPLETVEELKAKLNNFLNVAGDPTRSVKYMAHVTSYISLDDEDTSTRYDVKILEKDIDVDDMLRFRTVYGTSIDLVMLYVKSESEEE